MADLPYEILRVIVSLLDTIDVLETIQFLDTHWRHLFLNGELTRVFRFTGQFPRSMASREAILSTSLMQLPRCRIKQLEVEGCPDFSVYELLRIVHYNRVKSLRKLKLIGCTEITGGGLTMAAGRMVFLKDVEIRGCPLVGVEGLLGLTWECRRLTHVRLSIGHPRFTEEDAIAVAERFPRLRFFELRDSDITREGVTRIVTGCPRLRWLDLRGSHHLLPRDDAVLQRWKARVPMVVLEDADLP